MWSLGSRASFSLPLFLGGKKTSNIYQEFSCYEILLDTPDFWLCVRIWALKAGSQFPHAMQVCIGRLEPFSQCKCQDPPCPLQPAEPPEVQRQSYQHQTVAPLTACWAQEVKQPESFRIINFARNDFHSSEFGLWRCYSLCTSLFPV